MGMKAKEIIVEMLKAEARGAGVYLTSEGQAWLDRLTQEEIGTAQAALKEAGETA